MKANYNFRTYELMGMDLAEKFSLPKTASPEEMKARYEEVVEEITNNLSSDRKCFQEVKNVSIYTELITKWAGWGN